jgi:hypothetical protein
MMTIVRFLAVAAAGFFGGLMPVWAQGGSGTIRGQVTDPAGGSIPGAAVSANNGHGTSRSATADVRGEFVLANLPAGAYTVRVSAKGFALAERSDVAVGSGAARKRLSLRIWVLGINGTENRVKVTRVLQIP